MRAAVYERISDDKMGRELGVLRQREDGTALAERRGWEPVVFGDNDISATRGRHRPGYADLMAAVDRGEVQRIIVWHTSRLWRNRRERAEGIERLQRARVSVVPVKGPELDMSTAYGRGMAGMIGEFDTMESEVKAERQQREAEQRAKRGEPGGGRRGFGYDAAGRELHRCEYDDECEAQAVGNECDGCEAHVGRAVYESVLAGRSLTGIAADLNAAGWRTTMGNPWRHNSVREFILNARNAGLRVYGGAEYPANWPAIVPEETYRAACVAVKAPDRRTNHVGSARKHLGTGLYLCGGKGCGRAMICTYRDSGSRIYRCKTCGLSRRADQIDAMIREAVREWLSRPGVADRLHVGDPGEALRLRAEAGALRTRRDEAKTLFDEGVISAAELRGSRAHIDARLVEIRSRLESAGRPGALAAILTATDPVAAWLAIPDEQVDRQQAIVAALMTVRLLPSAPGVRRFDPSTVAIDWQ